MQPNTNKLVDLIKFGRFKFEVRVHERIILLFYMIRFISTCSSLMAALLKPPPPSQTPLIPKPNAVYENTSMLHDTHV